MQSNPTIIFVIFLIFTGTAILSTIALFTRQSLLVAYMILGAILGPWGLKLVADSAVIKGAGDIGIIFLLFLLGLNLQPQNLLHSIKKMSWVTLASSLVFFLIGFSMALAFHLNLTESVIVGLTMMFSSTIVGIKLLPTTILHHQHTGELMISILLLQDIIAIAILLVFEGLSQATFSWQGLSFIFIAFPILLLIAYVFERYILINLLKRFDKIHEYIFILSVGWCLLMAELAHLLGLSEEIGAFIGGVALASNPISLYIADNLRPLRDFFLVIFFFSIGAGFNFAHLPQIILPAILLGGSMLLIKPYVFQWLLHKTGEKNAMGREVGVRLAQMSEFSLLIIFYAVSIGFVSATTSDMIEAATIFTFIVSSYWVTMRYPTPLAASDKLRRD